MNKKNKVLISAAGMLVLTAAAASASTFAWFTTVRNATINYSQAEVYSSSSSLTISFLRTLSSSISSDGTALGDDEQHMTVSGMHRITDISGNGATFYKPIWNSADKTSEDADEVIDLPSGLLDGVSDGYYVDFTISVAQSTEATGNMNVYIGAGTTITPHNPEGTTPEQAAKNDDAVACARLAILDEAAEPVFIWTPDFNDPAYNYVSQAPIETTWNTVPGYTSNSQTAAFDDLDTFHAGALTTYERSSEATLNKVYPIVKLYGTEDVESGTPSDPTDLTPHSDEITIRAWIEGEDKECVNTLTGDNALGGIFDFKLDIYGIAA